MFIWVERQDSRDNLIYHRFKTIMENPMVLRPRVLEFYIQLGPNAHLDYTKSLGIIFCCFFLQTIVIFLFFLLKIFFYIKKSFFFEKSFFLLKNLFLYWKNLPLLKKSSSSEFDAAMFSKQRVFINYDQSSHHINSNQTQECDVFFSYLTVSHVFSVRCFHQRRIKWLALVVKKCS